MTALERGTTGAMRTNLRFEVMAAYAVGILLPVAEVARRRDDFSNIPAYVDDFILGALLLFAARSVSTARPTGYLWMIAAWSVYCGAMYYSFFGQLTATESHDVSGLSNSTVVAVKAMLFLTGLVALAESVRSARKTVTAWSTEPLEPDELAVQAWFAQRGYAPHVVRGGLEGAVSGWEAKALWVASGDTHTYFEEYLNDMEGRRILQEGLDLLPRDAVPAHRRRVERADAVIRAHLVPTRDCIWGERFAAEHGLVRERDWWYYHRPTVTEESWPDL